MSLKTQSTSRWKDCPLFLSPIANLLYLNAPHGVRVVVLSWLSSSRGIRWNAFSVSTLLKIFDPRILDAKWRIFGSGYVSSDVLSLRPLKSPTALSSPLALSTKCNGDDHNVAWPGGTLSTIPNDSNSSQHSFPLTAFGEPRSNVRGLAVHGALKPVSMWWTTLCFSSVDLKSHSCKPGYLSKISWYYWAGFFTTSVCNFCAWAWDHAWNVL